MTIFVMDAETAQKLRSVAQYADHHRIDLVEMKARHEAHKAGRAIEPFGPQFCAILPMGFRVVFTIEEHPLRDGSGSMWLRHMSMSSPKRGRAPIEPALEWVMGQLGYTTPLRNSMVYREDTGPDSVAINVIEEYRAGLPQGTA